MNKRFIGIDGEGIGRAPHKYVLLAASDSTGTKRWSVENSDGLTTDQCLGFLADLGFDHPDVIGFTYSFNYDITKMLQGLPNSTLYRIVRPDERRQVERKGSPPRPTEQIVGPYRINLFGGQLTVRRGRRNGELSSEKGLLIWDVFKFFQGPFVKALEDWQVGIEDVEMIQRMKEARSSFTSDQSAEIKNYCFKECMYLAQLVEKLTEAHKKAGLTLKNYYGAGSTAAALLDKIGIKQVVKKEIPYSKQAVQVNDDVIVSMRSAAMRAFFGGRFENSIIGSVKEDIYNYDISSAYPYQTTQLPCLQHGLWKITFDRKDLEKYKHALVMWGSSHELFTVNNCLWGALPFRYKGGTIIFPVVGGSGFVYKQEFLQAEKFGRCEFLCAWVLDQDCDCQPFKDIPHYYNERLKLGKDGAGIVLKLGVNACYGKLAQSVGMPQYASWIWAGMITSGCRAQLLEAAHCHKDINNMLAVATDGVYSLEKLDLPIPIETGTSKPYYDKEKGKLVSKPLGGWEEKVIKGGMFFGRPGVNFALVNPDDAKLARGRGYGRKIISKNALHIIESFEAGAERHVFPNVTRFNGAKNSISRAESTDLRRLNNYTRSPKYGEWTEEAMKLDFTPLPKRSERRDNRLLPWKLVKPMLSAEYDRAMKEEDEYGRIGKEQPE